MKVPKRAPLDAVHHLLICSIVREFSGRIYCKSYILEFGLKRIYFSNVVLTRKGLSRYRKGVGVPGMQPALILGPGAGETAGLKRQETGNRFSSTGFNGNCKRIVVNCLSKGVIETD